MKCEKCDDSKVCNCGYKHYDVLGGNTETKKTDIDREKKKEVDYNGRKSDNIFRIGRRRR